MEWEKEITPITGTNDSFLLKLTDGITPGRFEAAVNFSQIFSELKRRFPSVKFQLTPFLFTDDAVFAYLAFKES